MISNASTFVTQCVTGWAKLSFYLNLSKITKAEESLPTSYFRLPTSNFLLPTSNFQLPTSDFRLPTSNFWHTYRFTVVFASGRQNLPPDSRAYSLKLFRDWSLFIGRGELVQMGGGPPFSMHGLKGGLLKKYGNVLLAKMLKAAFGCHQQIQPIKIALYNNFY